MKITDLLLKLIEKKFYETKEEVINKCNVFFAMNVITEEEYSNLILKAEAVYYVAPVDETVIEEETVVETEEGDVANETNY